MATKKLQILTELRPTDETMQSMVDGFFADNPIGKSLLDKFCPPFEASGSVVTCHPAEGYPLEVEWQTKNLFDDVGFYKSNGLTQQADGSWLGGTINKTIFVNTEKKSGSMYLTATVKTDVATAPVYLIAQYTDGTQSPSLRFNASDTFSTKTVTTDANKTVDSIRWTYGSAGTYYIKDVMISFVDANYEPYAETATITRCGKNLCTVDTVELVSKGMNKKIWSGNLSAPLVVSAKPSNIEFAAPSSSLLQCTVDGATKYVAPEYAQKGYKITSGTLTEIRVINWCDGTGVANIQLEPGTTATDFEPYNGGTFQPVEPITAIQGVNTIYADVGLVTVTGRADPNHIIDTLSDRIAALEAAAVNDI